MSMLNPANILKALAAIVGVMAVVIFVGKVGQPSSGLPSQEALAQQVATNTLGGDDLKKAITKAPAAHVHTEAMKVLWEVSDGIGRQAVEDVQEHAGQGHPHGQQIVALTDLAARAPLIVILFAVFSAAAAAAYKVLRGVSRLAGM